LRHEPSSNLQSEPSLEPSAETPRKLKAIDRQKAFQRKRQGVEVVQNRIARRFGADGWLILQSISASDLAVLTGMQERNRLSDSTLEEFRLLWKANRGAAA
jgi:hypothetical protein